ncbi:MAG: hypothetical protein V1735_04640 [Nanoarchaeota archaeon]
MVAIDVARLRKMRPDQRIEELKALSSDLQKEIRDREKEIKDTEKLLHESRNELERNRVAEMVKPPEQKPVEISDLFQGEGATVEEKAAPEGETIRYQMIQDYEFVKGAVYQTLQPEDVDQLQGIQDRLRGLEGLQVSTDVANLLVATRNVLYNIKKYQGL